MGHVANDQTVFFDAQSVTLDYDRKSRALITRAGSTTPYLPTEIHRHDVRRGRRDAAFRLRWNTFEKGGRESRDEPCRWFLLWFGPV